MKLQSILYFTLLLASLSACNVSEEIPSKPFSLTSKLHARSIITSTSLAEGSIALFNASGGIQMDNQLLAFDGSTWQSTDGTRWTEPEEETYLTVLYPTYANNAYTPDNLYADGQLEDILIAKDTLAAGEDVKLQFKHLFSLLSFSANDLLQSSLKEIHLTIPQTVNNVSPQTGEISLVEEERTATELQNETGVYNFLLPPMEEATLSLSIVLQSGEEYTHVLPAYTFESGVKYECKLTQADTRPGIRTAEDLIAFSKLYYGKTVSGRSLDDFRETRGDSVIYRLLADIELTEEESAKLIPIGYSQNKTFDYIFDGGNHCISNLTIPDKSVNETAGSYVGLFGCIGTEGVVMNLHLANASSVSSPESSTIGGIAARNQGKIINCSVQGSSLSSSSGGYVGGICGRLVTGGHIINCYTANNKIITNDRCKAGGLVGEGYGNIFNSYTFNNNMSIKYNNGVTGGLVGGTSSTASLIVSNCYTYFSSSVSDLLGVLIGYAVNVTIDNCFYNKENYFYTEGSNVSTTNLLKYDDSFSIDGNHISNLLNEWIETTGKTTYPDISFSTWETAEDGSAKFK